MDFYLLFKFFVSIAIVKFNTVSSRAVKKTVLGPIYGKDIFCPKTKSELKTELKAEENTQNKLPEGMILEGDIRVNQFFNNVRQRAEYNSRDFLQVSGYTWETTKIPFEFEEKASTKLKEVVQAAINDFNNYTCVRFIPRTTENDYIVFASLGGCYSNVGKVGGKQDISLGDECLWKGTAIHEMMHALGFFHEHTRLDRDEYVTINFENIEPEMTDNFLKYNEGVAGYLDEPYDYQSVMHYPSTAFSKNGQLTIEPKDKSVKPDVIGQRHGFSKIDLIQLNKAFKCNKPKPTMQTKTQSTVQPTSNKKTSSQPITLPESVTISPTTNPQFNPTAITNPITKRTSKKPFFITKLPIEQMSTPQKGKFQNQINSSCSKVYPCWPNDFQLATTNQQPCCTGNHISGQKCQCHCMNTTIGFDNFLCYKKKAKDPMFSLSDTKIQPNMECLSLKTNQQPVEKNKYLCYAQDTKYQLYWSHDNAEKLHENKCLLFKNKSTELQNSRNGTRSYLCRN